MEGGQAGSTTGTPPGAPAARLAHRGRTWPQVLGRAFDIHGGGEDLIFPHHENEIAQSEGATGEPFARYWLHNAFLELKGEKMAKSVGNVVSPRELLARHRGVVLRYALLGAHYRSPLEFSEEVLADAAASYDRLATFATNARALAGGGGAGSAGPSGWRTGRGRLDDDLTPRRPARAVRLVASQPPDRHLSRAPPAVAGHLRDRSPPLAGLPPRLPPLATPRPGGLPPVSPPLDLREQAARTATCRRRRIPDRLAHAGIRVEDGPGGPRWHLIP